MLIDPKASAAIGPKAKPKAVSKRSGLKAEGGLKAQRS